MSIQSLQDYTFYAKYAKYNKKKNRRETWRETVDRVFAMHAEKYAVALEANPEFRNDFDFAKQQVYKKRVLGAQRALQFGGEPIVKKNQKIFNCSVNYIDRPRSFQEIMYLLLNGCGVGFSVQRKHINQLPKIYWKGVDVKRKTFVIPDSIEGWADAVGILVNSFFSKEDSLYPEYSGYYVDFDFSQIRPEGSPISGGFKAPGPNGLKKALEHINRLLSWRSNNSPNEDFSIELRPIDCYDIIMYSSDAVLSGGVRRSATICLFSPDDEEMLKAKTGKWYLENPQRGRSNNSVLLVRNKTTREEFAKYFSSIKEFGEPGFVWADDEDVIVNPCVEIGFYAKNRAGESGVSFCNLCEINGKKIKTTEDFMQASRAAAIIGTLQAGYTDFPYLGKITEEIVREEALLGVSITGLMDSPDILFNEASQKAAAQEVLKVNERVAGYIGINPCARGTCVKPAGSTSCILGTSSGIHPHHAKRYIRRVQANKLEWPAQHFKSINPLAVEDSVWSTNNTDVVLSFLCEVPAGSITKNQTSAIELLEKVKLTQQNWVEYGTRPERGLSPKLRHNVSNTITVKPEEWDEVEEYIYTNRESFAGISLLPFSGDKDYPQAPFTSVHIPNEIVDMYGDGAIMASGLIVDGLAAFNNNLWAACDSVLDIGESVAENMEKPVEPAAPDKSYTKAELKKNIEEWSTYIEASKEWEKSDWIRRAKQFAERYFSSLREMTYCLKDVYNYKLWVDLKREYKEIDWSEVEEVDEHSVDVNTTAGAACSGGACEINF